MKLTLAAIAVALAGCASAPDGRQYDRTDDRFARVQLGMTQDETLALVGRPDQTMPFPLSGQMAWSYVYQDGFGYMVEHSITFGSDGRVASRISRRMNDGGGYGNK